MRNSIFGGLWCLATISVLWACDPSSSKPSGDGSSAKSETNSGGQNKPDSGKEKNEEKGAGKASENAGSDGGPNDEESDDGSKDESGGPQPNFDMSIPDAKSKKDLGCDIDFLFIVDNSVSMVDNQESLAASVPGFIKSIEEGVPNLERYHIGVISTDENRFNGTEDSKNCAAMGGLVTRTVDYSKLPFENICAPYASGKNFMDNGDDLSEKFSCAAKMGAMGSGNERPMDAIQTAFSEEMNKKGACNEGFFREDAVLVVVLVTDEEDDIEVEDGFDNGSKGEPEDWYKTVLEFKNNRPELVVMLSLLGKPKPNECDWTYEPGGEPKDEAGIKSAEVSRRLIEFTKKFGKSGVVGDVCADNYDGFFKKALSVIQLSCEEAPK